MRFVLLTLLVCPLQLAAAERGTISSSKLPALAETARSNLSACGPIAVWYYLSRLGHAVDRDELIAASDLTAEGATIGGLLEMLAEHGCTARAISTDKSRLALLPAPAILIVDKGMHCIVFDGLDDAGEAARVFETTSSEVRLVKKSELLKSWTGEVIMGDSPRPSRSAMFAVALIVIVLISTPAALFAIRRNGASSRARAGFTMIELMVGIGIVGLVLALLLPGLQQARESSRNSQCRNNLHQIGLAFHSYQSSFRAFPPAVVWSPKGEPLGQSIAAPGSIDRISFGVATPSDPDRVHANWAISLLSYLEEDNLYLAFDLKRPLGDPANETGRATELAIMKCPSDPANEMSNHFQRAGLGSKDRGYARGNYAINGGTSRRCLTRLSSRKIDCKDGVHVDGTNLLIDTSQVLGNGIAGVNRSVRPTEISAGLSQVVLVEEVRSGTHPLDRRGVWSLGFPGSSVTSCHGLYGNNGPNIGKDAIQGCSDVMDFAPDLESRRMACLQSSNRQFEISERATARSMHAGGVHLLMADGSTHFAVDSIDKRVWHNLHKRDHAQPIEF